MAKKKRTSTQPKVLKDLSYVADVTAANLGGEIPVAVMPLSATHRRQIGFLPGTIFRMTVDDAELTGMVIEADQPNPLRQTELEKRRRKAKNFATAQVVKSSVTFEIIKQTRVNPFRFPDGVHRLRLNVVEKPTVGISKAAVSKEVKTRKDSIPIPKKNGKPGACVDRIVELSQADSSWRQSLVFETDGKVMIGRVDISPPTEGVNIAGKPYKIGAQVFAYVGEHKKGGVATASPKEFKGWAASVGRAFAWVAKQAKGGTMVTKLSKLERSGCGGKKPKNSKQAEAAAIAAWKEVLGIEP